GVVGVAVWVVSRGAGAGGRRAAVVLGAALVGFAGLAAVVLREPGGGYRGSPVRRGVELVRVAGGTSLSLLYALALGGVVAVSVYLPAYLIGVFDLAGWLSLTITAAMAVVGS